MLNLQRKATLPLQDKIDLYNIPLLLQLRSNSVDNLLH